MNSLFEQLTNQMREAIESAISLALHSKNQEASPLHVLWGLITNSASILNQVFNKMNIDKSAIELEVKSEIQKITDVFFGNEGDDRRFKSLSRNPSKSRRLDETKRRQLSIGGYVAFG